MNIKRIMAGIASFMVALSPMNVYADDTVYALNLNTGENYYSISDAWTSACSGNPIRMAEDWNLDSALVVGENQEVSIQMNGHVICRQLETREKNGNVIKVEAGANLSLLGDLNVTRTINVPDYKNDTSGDTSTQVSSGGFVTGGKNTYSGGGIIVEKDATLRLSYVGVSGNMANTKFSEGCGGGVFLLGENSTLVLDSNAQISNNYARRSGGGVYVEAENAQIQNSSSTISNNIANYGGGICSNGNNTQITLKDAANIDENSANYVGGGVYFGNTNFTLKSTSEETNSISKNTSHQGAGVYVNQVSSSSNSGLIENVTFDSNRAEDGDENYGGAIYLEQENVHVKKCVLTNNYAAQYGGGIYNYNDDNMIDNCTITNNEAGVAGGGIYQNEHEDITLSGKNVIKNNKRTDGASDDLMLEKTWLYTAYVKGEITSDSSVGIRTGDSGTTKIGVDITSDPGSAVFLNDSGEYHIEYKDGELYKSDGSLLGSIFGNSNLGMAIVVIAGISVVGIIAFVVNKKKKISE